MDKVQFNTQIVNTRKTVKRTKVQLIRHLTRQITIIRKKKGSGQQLVKNERRAGRLVKEIEAIKDFAPDEVTMSAVINKESLEAVLGKATSTAEERAMARLIHHKLISSRVAAFKDLVTDDLLSIGKKKEKVIQRTADYIKRKGSKASSEDSEHDTDNSDDDANTSDDDDDDDDDEHRRAGKVRNSDNDTDEEDDDDDEGDMGVTTKASGSGRLGFTELSLLAQTQRLREQMNSRHQKKSNFFLTDDKDNSSSEERDIAVSSKYLAGMKSRSPKSKESALSNQTIKPTKQAKSEPKKNSAFFLTDNDDGQDSNEEGQEDDSDEEMREDNDDDDDNEDSDEEMGKSLGDEFLELSAEIKKNERRQGKGGVVEQPRKLRGLDSMFVGKLSGSNPTQSLAASSKGQKNRVGQAKRQIINKKKRLEELRRPRYQGSAGRHVALVDMSSLDSKGRDKQPTRIIPGINAPIQTKTRKDASSEKVLPSQRPLLLALSRRERRERMRLDGSKKGRTPRGQDGRGGQGGKGTSETLHPSWEAKKRKKEQEAKILPFLGKKITFDD